MVNKNRIKKLNTKDILEGDVYYWMRREQRINDNWALIHAYDLAKQNNKNLHVVFLLSPNFLGATNSIFNFMLEGLIEISIKLSDLNIKFSVILEEPKNFWKKTKCGALVTDFSPLKIAQQWNDIANQAIDCAFFEVDAHNVVPVWQASQKKEFAAHTFRPKLHKLLPDYLEVYPKLAPLTNEVKNEINWEKIKQLLDIKSPKVYNWIHPGEDAALNSLNTFINENLSEYENKRNFPDDDVQSQLSPHLHFGHISSQTILLKLKNERLSPDSFIEELFVRKELADNFCYYEPNYDNFNGFHNWAKKTLNEHKNDKREYIYSLQELENSQTHDDLWNAAQTQMVKKGKMHGYLRMYWAKKILEWTPSPQEAQEMAIYLNDKYELDGRDPNGYTGIAWSIGGIHDRAWIERPIFGKIRYMNYNGCKRKFDVNKYIIDVEKL